MIVRKFEDIEGIKIFDKDVSSSHLDYNSSGIDNLFEQEEKHFWFVARKEFILKNILGYINKKSNLIEIGAGTGNVSRYLMRNGYKNISVGEMHLKGLKYAQSYGIKETYQFDLLNSPFRSEFDAVCLFDVLEHIKDDESAIEKVYDSLKDSGYIVLTVPSHMWLWNDQDRIAGHKIRYTKKQLVQKLQKNGFEVISAKYFFIFIIPLLLFRRILHKDKDVGKATTEEVEDHDLSMNQFVSNILLFFSRVENAINDFMPNIFGGSLFILAQKKSKVD